MENARQENDSQINSRLKLYEVDNESKELIPSQFQTSNFGQIQVDVKRVQRKKENDEQPEYSNSALTSPKIGGPTLKVQHQVFNFKTFDRER